MQPKELRVVVGRNIRSRRIELEMTQTELAVKIPVSQAYLSQIESGVRSVDVDLLAPIAEALKTTPAALFSAEAIFSSNAY